MISNKQIVSPVYKKGDLTLIVLLMVSSLVLVGCSQNIILETPQGELKVENLTYIMHSGTFYANDPHRLVLTLTRVDNKMFSVNDLNYIIQSGAYLKDNQGKVYKIPDSVRDSKILASQTDEFRLEFSGKPGKDRGFILHWPDNSPLEIEREKHYLIDG